MDNFSKKQTSTSMYLSLVIGMLFFLVAGLQPAQAQTRAPSQEKIPAALIAKNQYTASKVLNPKITFHAATPWFIELTIVDGNDNPMKDVITTTDGTVAANTTKKTFDFSNVAPDTYYAKDG
ncbi:hypothetical protein [Flectobacillus longus]|uniref:hypothetical protein n=1 Tax=Flectobacillus longus TaxID=2984207 RepID=UPI0024B707F0|nr:hypothetical protein [Flectobacillus longus]MDI9882792.1 hypothetical protein [Flectobacillus longus]